MSTAQNEIDWICSEIKSRFPNAEQSQQLFPSGAYVLDIRMDSRFFVVMSSPGEQYGVDEVLDDDGFGTACKFSCDSIENALPILLQLISQPSQRGAIM